MIEQQLIGATVHFQPIIDLVAWRVCGVEALARFTDSRSPLDHLAQARAAGAELEFEIALLKLAQEVATELPSGLLLSLNMSAATALHPDVEALLAKIDSHQVGMEILETSPRFAEATRLRERADSLGALLLIDDAGIGNSDEVRIRYVRPDIVKIDRGLFAAAAATDAKAQARVASLLCEARAVGAKVLVEGIETLEQLDRARALGCDMVQGYFFGPACELAGLAERLQEIAARTGVALPEPGTNADARA